MAQRDKAENQNTPVKLADRLPSLSEFLGSIGHPRTAQTYHYSLGMWATFLNNKKSVKLTDVGTWTDVLVADYHAWLIGRGYKRSSVALYLVAARRYLQYLNAHDLIGFSMDKALNKWYEVRGGRRYKSHSNAREADPGVPKIVVYYDSLELPTGDEYKNWLKRIEILRARAVVHTLYASAGRASEICSLTREQIRDGRLSECKIVGKGGDSRTLLLTPEAQRAIRAYCKERDDEYPALFISHGRGAGNPLSRGTVWSIVKKAAIQLGLNGFSSPHAFRHYRAQSLLDSDMPLETIQAYLGHKDISLTRRVYAPKTSVGKIRAQLEKYGVDPQTAAERLDNAPLD